MITMSPDLSADFQALIDHVTAKTTETKSHVTSKNTETKNLVSSENDDTQATLANLGTSGELDANTINVNAHTTSEANRILSDLTIPSFTPETDLSGQNKNVLQLNSTVLDSSKFNAVVGSDTLETQVFQPCTGYLTRLQLRRGWEFELWIDGKLFLSRYGVSNTSNNDVLLPHTYIIPEPVRINTSIELKVRKHADMSPYWTGIDVIETK